jgi:transcriptional regulator with XRE-family HTH domain
MLSKGLIIKHKLEKAGLTEAEVARKAKVSRSYVSQIIYGQRKAFLPKGQRVKKIICRVIKADPERLWGREKPKIQRRNASAK